MCGNTVVCWLAICFVLSSEFLLWVELLVYTVLQGHTLCSKIGCLCPESSAAVVLFSVELIVLCKHICGLGKAFTPWNYQHLPCTNTEMLIVNGFMLQCQNKYQDGVKNVGCRKIRKSWFCVVSCLFLTLRSLLFDMPCQCKMYSTGCRVSEFNWLEV